MRHSILFVVLGFLSLSVSSIHSVKLRDCGSRAKIDFDQVHITGCAQNRCIFKKGEYANITIPFQPQTGFSSLVAKVYGIIGGVPIPFRLENPNACGRSIDCPVKEMTPLVYKEAMNVKKIFPSMSLKVRWILQDENNIKQVCFTFPVKLQ